MKEWKHEIKNDRHVKDCTVKHVTDGKSIYYGFCNKTSQMKRAFNFDNWSLHVKSDSHTLKLWQGIILLQSQSWKARVSISHHYIICSSILAKYFIFYKVNLSLIHRVYLFCQISLLC